MAQWALFTPPDIGAWNADLVALLGDAAHAMLLPAAQGAGMAIEDGRAGPTALATAGENIGGIPAALKRYTKNCAARGCCGYNASHVDKGVSNTFTDQRLLRATLRSRRWARTVRWRGRTGSATGGRKTLARPVSVPD